MRFHVLGIPHTKTTQEYLSCAYTQKVFKICRMLHNKGHEVYHYGIEESNPICTENISVVPKELYEKHYNYDWKSTRFLFDQNDIVYKTFHSNSISEIKKRLQPKDFILLAWGWGHKPVADAFPDYMCVESGIGYESTFAKFRVFESYTWMNHVYGLQNERNGSFYDCVIPNYFDLDDFDYKEKKEDWFLYLGRVVKRKGVELAVQVVEHTKNELIIAGQGPLCNKEEGINISSPQVKHVGFADVEIRRRLLSNAKALFVPTYYVEPFGGVVIEASLSGTPVITTDWGAFSENVVHGKTGYRCRTLDQFCWATRNIDNISPLDCRKWAIENFSIDRISSMYEEYFDMLLNLWKKGWYETKEDRTSLDWLNKSYP